MTMRLCEDCGREPVYGIRAKRCAACHRIARRERDTRANRRRGFGPAPYSTTTCNACHERPVRRPRTRYCAECARVVLRSRDRARYADHDPDDDVRTVIRYVAARLISLAEAPRPDTREIRRLGSVLLQVIISPLAVRRKEAA